MSIDFRTTSKTLLAELARSEESAEWQAAWERFVKHYGPPILGLCQRYGVRRSDVEDVLQEVLLKLQSSMAKFECRRWLKVVLERSMNDLFSELANSAPASDIERIRDALRTTARPANIGIAAPRPESSMSGRVRQVLAELTPDEEINFGSRWWEAGAAIWHDSRPSFDDFFGPLLRRSFLRWGLEDELAGRAAALLQRRINLVLETLGEDSLPKFRSWLTAVVRNAAKDCLEQLRNMARSGDERFAEIVNTVVDEADAINEFEVRELRMEAECRVQRDGGVSDGHWMFYFLMVHDGWTAPKVAKHLGATIGSVYMAVKRVRTKVANEVRRLQELIPPESDPEEP